MPFPNFKNDLDSMNRLVCRFALRATRLTLFGIALMTIWSAAVSGGAALADEAQDAADEAQDTASSEETLELSPLGKSAIRTLETYCLDCHSGDSGEGGIAVDFLSDPSMESLEKNIEVVEKIILVLKEQQMPPLDAEQPEVAERLDTLTWIESRLDEFDCGSASRPGRVTMRRLNRVEYDNTIRDLTGLDLQVAEQFPSDDVGNGFDNMGEVLTIPPILLEKYVDAAIQISGEVMASPEALKKVFPRTADPENLEEVVAAARANADEFASRAFRRPIAEEESQKLFELMTSRYSAGASVEDIQRTVIASILCSPHFIYRVESDEPQNFVDGSRPLNDFELASRLSYFLWSSMPDDRLLELAKQRQLNTPEQLEAEVDRMLADPKAAALVDNFAGQWLQLRDLQRLTPDPEMFSSFDEPLRAAMRKETELLFSNIIAEDRSVLELLNADYTYVNERLAQHYGIANIVGDEFRKVTAIGSRRGVLMHAGILMLTSNPTRTSPVKRGKWVMDNLLGEPPPPPPPDVPELGAAGETLGTLRQQMEQHRADPNCAVCHTKMDALGFGLENFDAIGSWRDLDGRDKINPAGELPGGKSFSGPVDLVQILAEDKKEEFCRCMIKRLLSYSLGRGLGVYDRCTVNNIYERMAGNEFRFSSLVKAIVSSPQFTIQEAGF